MVTALYKKLPPSPTTVNVEGALVTLTGTLKESVALSAAVWKVCCTTAPGTIVPSCCNSSEIVSGKDAPEAGARLPWNAAV